MNTWVLLGFSFKCHYGFSFKSNMDLIHICCELSRSFLLSDTWCYQIERRKRDLELELLFSMVWRRSLLCSLTAVSYWHILYFWFCICIFSAVPASEHLSQPWLPSSTHLGPALRACKSLPSTGISLWSGAGQMLNKDLSFPCQLRVIGGQ